MESVIEKIWSYGNLSEDEKGELEAFVLVNTQFAPLLDSSKAMHQLLKESGVFASDSVGHLAIAYLVAQKQFLVGDAPDIVEGAYKQLQQKINAMPHALERYSEVQARMERVASQSDPVTQFEELTGYNLEQDFGKEEKRQHISSRSFAGDRPELSKQKDRLAPVLWRRLSVAVLGCLVVLALGYYSNRMARTAYTSADVLWISEVVEERGLDTYEEPISPDVVFTHAQRVLFESQHVWAGLFYTFDEKQLGEAEYLFLRVKDDSLSSPFLKEESLYLLAKVYLAKRDVVKAQEMLTQLIELSGRRYEEARQLQAML